jgi:hypothetical protein
MFIRRIDVPLHADMSDAFRNIMLSSGGIALYAKADDVSFEDYLDGLPAVCRNACLTATGTFTFVLAELAACLEDVELEAILLHEEGHATLGHLDSVTAGACLNIEFEFAADAYAADRVGTAALISAFSKMRQFFSDVIVPELFGDADDDDNEDFLAIIRQQMFIAMDVVFIPRIERLQARL